MDPGSSEFTKQDKCPCPPPQTTPRPIIFKTEKIKEKNPKRSQRKKINLIYGGSSISIE